MWRESVWLLCAAALIGVVSSQAVEAGVKPIVYYSFDALADTIVDESGNGNDGTPNGDLAFVEGGYLEGCFEFNGSNTYVQLTRPIQDSFTLAAWMKTDTAGNTGTQAYEGHGLMWSDVGGTANDFVMAVLDTKLSFFAGNPDISVNSDGDIVTGEWVHIAGVRDTTAGTISVYIDGVLDNTEDHSNTNPLDAQEALAIGANTLDNRYYTGLMDEVKIYDVALSAAEVAKAMRGGITPELASDPSPKSGEADVLQAAALSWTAGEFAGSHDVYFGTSASDVESANRDNPLDVLVSEGQTATTYDPEGLLEYGQTYYWRVDEVNATADNTIFAGKVWNFTVEPFAYAIENIVATSNGDSDIASGPEKTIDGSGLADDDTHSAETTDMWAATTLGAEPVWIQYEFDKVYKLYELLVWNYNVSFESLIGFGFNEVTIEYSQNGTDWTVLTETQFAQGISRKGYAANTVVDLQGVSAQYVRLTANSNYGASTNYGLSEVRFLHKPVQARSPMPADGAADVSVDAVLDWRAGREVVSHDVSLGTDADALAVVDTVTDTTYNPGGLDLGMTYYWRVDEVNETTGTWEGPLWSFSTQEYILIDNFESYTDDEGNRIYEAWEDGWINGTGSMVGYLDAPFAEQTIVHGGRQSMPLIYDGDSEADLAIGQDWTENGIATLTLFFYGDLENDAAEVYVKIGDTKITGGGSTTMVMWKQWNIDLASAGVNLSNVTTLTIGVEGSGSGTIYVDDIRLYRAAPAAVTPVDPGTDNLVLHYAFENDATDGSGNGYDGVPMNNPFYDDAPGDLGRAMSFDGVNDYVELPIGSLISTLSDMSVATWINVVDSGNLWQRIFDFGSTGDGGYMFLAPYEGTSGPMRFAIEPAGGSESRVSTISELLPGWHHVAVTINSASMTASVYIDGTLDNSGSIALLPRDLGVTTQNWIGRSQYDGDGYLEALLTDFSIYDLALSDGEVNYLAGGR